MPENGSPGRPKVISYIKVIYKPEGEILTIDQKIGKYREEGNQ